LNLGEIIGDGGFHLPEDGVDVFLGRDHHPGPALADRAEVLRDRLQIEHPVRIAANKLPNFIHQEDQAMIWALFVEVGLDPVTEMLDRQHEMLFGPINPLLGSFRTLTGRRRPGRDDLIAMEQVGITLRHPFQAAGLAKGLLKGRKCALLVQIAFHMGDVRMIRTVALHLIHDFEEDR